VAINILLFAFLILPKLSQPLSITPSKYQEKFGQFILEGLVIEPPSEETPDRFEIEADLFKLDPNAGVAKMTIFLNDQTVIVNQNLATHQETPITIEDIKKNDRVVVTTVESLSILLSEGKLKRNSVSARKVTKLIFSTK
jgi:hypothetical protein